MQQIVVGPGQVVDLGDQLRPHPMHAAEHQGETEAAGARRRNVERHFVGSKRVFNLANPAEMTRNRNFSPPDALAGAAAAAQEIEIKGVF